VVGHREERNTRFRQHARRECCQREAGREASNNWEGLVKTGAENKKIQYHYEMKKYDFRLTPSLSAGFA
jgi:hypothetical protein